MERFDSIVAGSLDIAEARACQDNCSELSHYHLLWGLLENPASFSSRALKDHAGEVKKILRQLPKLSQSVAPDQLRAGDSLQKWLTLASGHKVSSGKEEMSETDLLRFMPQIFPDLSIDYNQLGSIQEKGQAPAFLNNLSELAKRGKLDPVIGRTKEIRAVMEILGRRNKNNPVLVGPAGVGKTAIVEGLALAIVKGEVPQLLQDKTVYALDMGALMAGTAHRGEFEKRLQTLITFITSERGQALLFIDEMHLLVGAGKTEGAMDAANLLKPALARGDLHCIGATTEEEFQKFILGDSALERRFRSVPVNAPSQEDAIEILMGIREKMEAHHGIKITDEAIFYSVILSEQYLTDKNLPDKAIDLVDEAASALKLSAEAMPAKLVELKSAIRSKKITAQVNKQDREMKQEIERLEKTFQEGREKWQAEVHSMKRVSELKNQLERHKFELEQAKREQDYEKAGRLKYSAIPQIEEQLKATKHDFALSRAHIAQVISRQSAIPVEKILKDKNDHILELKGYLKEHIFGQEEALEEIADILICAYAGLKDEGRPLASFLLKGPSGVGKTETAKALSRFLFDNEADMVRLDMSEYSEAHSVAKLIGAPAGYVGYEEGGALTEAVRRRPYCVILLDEIEKAHPDFANILLQILDDGRLTDNRGRTINFCNTLILMTTNSQNPQRDFRPEVLGRIDAQLTYKPLGAAIMKNLVKRQQLLLNQRMKSKNIEVKLDDQLVELLCKRGHDPRYGARPLASSFNKLVIRPLSKELLRGKLRQGVLTVGWSGNIEVSQNHTPQ